MVARRGIAQPEKQLNHGAYNGGDLISAAAALGDPSLARQRSPTLSGPRPDRGSRDIRRARRDGGQPPLPRPARRRGVTIQGVTDPPAPAPARTLRRSLRLEEQLTEAHQSQAQVRPDRLGVNDFFITAPNSPVA